VFYKYSNCNFHNFLALISHVYVCRFGILFWRKEIIPNKKELSKLKKLCSYILMVAMFLATFGTSAWGQSSVPDSPKSSEGKSEKNEWTVGILLYNDVEVFDFAGSFEVFAVTEQDTSGKPFHVKTVSEDGKMITARNGLKVQPDYSFDNAPAFDILIVPGGPGSRTEMYNKHII